MKRNYEEPVINLINYEILENISLNIEENLSGWENGDGEDFSELLKS